jgi:serine protease Do
MELPTVAEVLRRITVEVTSGERALGAGVVWAPEWIVTNAHVIAHTRVMVRGADGRRLDGAVVARDGTADLAVVRVPDLGLPAATCAESGSPRIGSLVIAVGHPFGLRGALHAAICSV